MWKKDMSFALYSKDGIIHVYDEKNLRNSLVSFLSDNSRSRYGDENFATNQMFIDDIQWHLDGLKCLLIS